MAITTRVLLISSFFSLFWLHALACSRVTYDSGAEDGHRIVVGRSMDWLVPTNSSIYAFPAGMARRGCAGKNSLQWRSKYGSVVTAMYEMATVDGMNTEGLVGNVLYLADGDYGRRNPSREGLSFGLWLQYFLDLYPNVHEAAADLFAPSGEEKFQLATKEIIPGVASLGHISLTDATGDNLIMEYIDGRLRIHHSRKYNVMTNEPSYDQQLAIDAYWQEIANFSLPGTDRPADRFARLSHYVRVAPASKDMISAVAATAGMIRAVSVPLEPTGVDTPNISPTLWRTYADTRGLRYFYESATEAVFLWVHFSELDLSDRGHIMRLELNGRREMRVGDMSTEFVKAKAFKPMEVDDNHPGDDGRVDIQQARSCRVQSPHWAPEYQLPLVVPEIPRE